MARRTRPVAALLASIGQSHRLARLAAARVGSSRRGGRPHARQARRAAVSSTSFRRLDTVRIVRLIVPDREVMGASAAPPQPHVGETGTVVEDVGEGLYLVEHQTADGCTVWLAEFFADELEFV